jgi:hypothetical protein
MSDAASIILPDLAGGIVTAASIDSSAVLRQRRLVQRSASFRETAEHHVAQIRR